MLNSKHSLQLKLLVRLLNSGNSLLPASNKALYGFVLGRYYQNLILNNSLVVSLTVKLLRLVDSFLGQKRHVFVMFAENTSPYFLLQMAALILKTRHRVSLCQEKYWAPGTLMNRGRLLELSGKKSSKSGFQLLTGFNSKPDLVLLFGVTNFFVIKEFVSSNLPTILFCLNTVNAPNGASYYIPKVNTFLLEDFIFVFIVKYTFFAR
jgi:hypothetical protein